MRTKKTCSTFVGSASFKTAWPRLKSMKRNIYNINLFGTPSQVYWLGAIVPKVLLISRAYSMQRVLLFPTEKYVYLTKINWDFLKIIAWQNPPVLQNKTGNSWCKARTQDSLALWWNTHLCTNPSKRLWRTWALCRIRRVSLGVLSTHWPFMIGLSNMLQNSALLPR
jgi:hypothetical protein